MPNSTQTVSIAVIVTDVMLAGPNAAMHKGKPMKPTLA